MPGYRSAPLSWILAATFVTVATPAVHAAAAPPAAPVSGPSASANDTARAMAGLAPSAGSPLANITSDPLWNQYAKSFDDNWTQLDSRQMTKVRTWSSTNVKDQSSTLFYMFSGPDYLYADAFMPAANTYVMSGLEPVGSVPDLRRLNAREMSSALNELRHSMVSLLSFSFFQTKLMSGEMRLGRIVGTTPVLMVFLARTGKTIYNVDFYDLASDGTLHPADEKIKTSSHAVKITFSDNIGPKKTLYYFNTDVSNKGVRNNGFLTFCDKLGNGDGLVKGASYLMHNDDFSEVRNFLLTHSHMILQDDTGIPIRFMDKGWKLHPYGSYVGPIRMFSGNTQAAMFKLFKDEKPGDLDFGIGYRFKLGGSNLVLAVRDGTVTAAELTQSPVVPAPAANSSAPKSPKVVYRRRTASKGTGTFGGLFGYSP